MNGIQWSEMEQNGELWSRELWSGVVLDIGKWNIVKEFQVNNFR